MNLAFEQKLKEHLERPLDVTFHSIATCSIHPVHESIWNGINAFSYDLDGSFNNIGFVSNCCHTKRGLNINLETVAEKAATYTLKHTETRGHPWRVLYMWIREQWGKWKECSLKFLPERKKKLSDFYKSIKEALENNLAETYTSLCALVTKGLKVSLIHFMQTNL